MIKNGYNVYVHITLLEIMSFVTNPYATTMSHVTTNGCLCNYFSNLDEVWYSFQLSCDYDLFCF
jgi:hypothetical protein